MSDLELPADDELTPAPADEALPADEELAALPADEELTPAGPGEGVVAPSVTGFTVEDVGAEVVRLEEDRKRRELTDDPWIAAAIEHKRKTGMTLPGSQERIDYLLLQQQHEETVRRAFKDAMEPGVSPKDAAARVANHFEIGLDVVEADLDGWLRAYAQAKGDPKRWIRENPTAARAVFEHPERADVVVESVKRNAALRAWDKAVDWLYDHGIEPLSSDPEVNAEFQKEKAEQLAGRAERDAPEDVPRRDTDEAYQMRQRGDSLEIIGQRGEEAQRELYVSKLYSELLWARQFGKDTTYLEARIRDAEDAAIGLALREEGATQALAEGWATSQSTLDVLKAGIQGGEYAAALGTMAAVTAAGVATRGNPQAMQAAAAGAFGLSWKFGMSKEMVKRSFDLEGGDSYRALLKTKTASGEPLTDEEARGGAIIAGALKSGIEMAELSLILKALGPAGALLEGGGVKAMQQQLATNPGLRELARRAARAWVGEGLEEVSQGATDDIINYLVRAKHDAPRLADLAVAAAAGGNVPLALTAAAAIPAAAPQEGPVVDTRAREADFFAGLQGGLGMAALGLSVSAGIHALNDVHNGAMAAAQAVSLADLAADSTVAPFARELAAAIELKSRENGQPTTHVHVDAQAFRRLFQTEEEAQAAVTQLMGANGAAALAGAQFTGGRLVVPLEDYLSKWALYSKQLGGDTATGAGRRTPNEQKAKEKADKAWAESIADRNRPRGLSPTLDRFDDLELQLKRTGRDVGDATANLQPLRDFFDVMAKKFGQDAETLFRDVRIVIDDGTGELKLEPKVATASERLSEQLRALTPEQAAEQLFIDPLTELYTFDAFEGALQDEPSGEVWSLTLADIKPVNDAPQGGHDTSNALLRAVSPAIAAVDPRAARKGTNFVGRGGQAELQRALEGVRAVLPQGMRVEGAVGANPAAALSTMDAVIDAARKAGTLPERGTTEFNLEQLPAVEQALSKTPVTHRVKATERQVAEVRRLRQGGFFRRAYQDKRVPSVLSGVAWHLLPRKAWVASIDIRGLKDINALGKDVGDRVLDLFAQVAARNDGSLFDFAHLSGDEYAAQHDSREALEQWLGHLETELRREGVSVPVRLTAPDGTVFTKRVAARFRSGVGERSYGAADRVLNAAKREEKRLAEEAARRDVAGRGGRAGEEGLDVRARDEAGAAAEGADAGGAREDRPGVRDGGLVADTSFDPDALDAELADDLAKRVAALIAERASSGSLRAEEAEAIRNGFNTNERLTEARAATGRFRSLVQKAGKKATEAEREAAVQRAQERADIVGKFLSWVQNIGPGILPESSPLVREGATRVTDKAYREVLRWAEERGIVDPENGLTRILEANAPPVDEQLRRPRGVNPRSTYERELKRDRQEDFNRNVLGRQVEGPTPTGYQIRNAPAQGLAGPDGEFQEAPTPPARDEAIERALNQEGRDFTAVPNEDGSVTYWSTDENGENPRVDVPVGVEDAAFDDGAVEGRWREPGAPSLSRQALRSVRAASAPSSDVLERIRKDTGAPVRNDGTISAEETVRSFKQTRQAEEWLVGFREHPAVVEHYAKEDIDSFEKAVLAHRALIEAGLDLGLLPAEGQANPLRKNEDFALSFDISTICPRQDQFTATVMAVERALGRLLEPMQRHLVGLMLRDVGAQPACWYCYGQAGRNAYDIVVAKSAAKAQQVVDLYKATPRGKSPSTAAWQAIFHSEEQGTKWNPRGRLAEFLRANWKALDKMGLPDEVRLRDIVRGEAAPRSDLEKEYAAVVRKHASGSTHANDPKGWGTLRNQILDQRTMPALRVALLNARAGLRMNSQTDFRPWHVIEVAEAVASMAARGLKAHVYTKENGFLRVFGRTGIKFNLSAFYSRGSDGKLQRDKKGRPVFDKVIGMAGEDIEHWMRELPGAVGGMLVAHNDEALLEGLKDERILQVIPYHAGTLSQTPGIGRIEGARDYSKFQHEKGWETRPLDLGGKKPVTEVRVGKEWVRVGTRVPVTVAGKTVTIRAGKDLDASTHGSDQAFYLALCKHLGLKPKFAELTLADAKGREVSVIGPEGRPIPGYMKLVRDVAADPASHEAPDPKRINWKAAEAIEKQWVDEGGDKTSAAPELVRHVLDRIQKNDWPSADKVRSQEEIDRANAKVYGKNRLNQLDGFNERSSGVADGEVRFFQREKRHLRAVRGVEDLTPENQFREQALADLATIDDAALRALLPELRASALEQWQEIADDATLERRGEGRKRLIDWVLQAAQFLDDEVGVAYTGVPEKLAEAGYSIDDQTGKPGSGGFPFELRGPRHWSRHATREEAEKYALARIDKSPRTFRASSGPSVLGFTEVARDGMATIYRIGLNPKANRSTFLHESAHVFLELFGQLAERADAPEAVRRDWATTLAWLGAPSREAITTDHHEKWAEVFELYLAKGKAPAERLKGPFRRFRLWMGEVYRGLVMKREGQLSPDIQGVFDRLLATDRELEDVSRAAGQHQPLPQGALGMTPEEYEAYLEERVDATSRAREQIDFQVAKDELRHTEAWWRELEQKYGTEAAAKYETLPARVAQQVLQGKEAGGFLGLKVRLDRAVVEAMVGAKQAARLPLAADGLHPDELAQAEGWGLGYATGRDLVEAVLALPEKDDYVQAEVARRMVEQHPGLLDERTKLREVVAAGLHGPATLQWVVREWQALARRGSAQNPATGTPTMPSLATLEHAARLLVDGMTAREIRPLAALADERRAADAAQRAAIRGQFAQAAAFKQQQVLAMLKHRRMVEARQELEQLETLAGKLSQPKARQRLGKAAPIFLEAVDTLLGAAGLASPRRDAWRPLGEVLLEAERAVVESGTTVGFDRERVVDRLRVAATGAPWRALPLEDVRHILNALHNFELAARNRTKVLVADKEMEREQVLTALHAELEALPKRPPEPTPSAASPGERAARAWNQFDGGLLKQETLAKWLSGAKTTADFVKSTWFKAIVEPLQTAKHREVDLLNEALKPLLDAWEKLPPELEARGMEAIDGKALFPSHIGERLPTRRFEVLVMLLNAGNAGNLARLTEGRNITLEQVVRAAEAVGITREEYAWVQAVWDAAESLKPMAFNLEEQDSGVRPEEVQAQPLVTHLPGLTLRGGYFPAVYDRITRVGKLQEVTQLADLGDPTFTRPGTLKGHLKQRTEGFSDIISLEPGSIQRHFAQVVHDVAYRRAVRSVGNLLLDEGLQRAMRERLGTGRAEQLLAHLADVATQRGTDTTSGVNWLRQLALSVRANTVTAVLGYKLPNALEDLTSGLASILPASDVRRPFLSGALTELAGSPRELRAFALSKSGELRARKGSLQRDLAKRVKGITLSKAGRLLERGPVGAYKEHAFVFQEGVDVAVSTATWLAAYRQALAADPTDDAAAVTFADATVRKVLVSHSLVDQSAIMRDRGIIGYVTMFHGAFNHFYNQFHDISRTGEGGAGALAATVAARASLRATRALGLATGIFLLGALARGQGPERDEPWAEWVVRKLLLEGLLQTAPGFNALGNAWARALTGKPATARNNSLFGVAEAVGDAIVTLGSEKDASKKVRAVGTAAGPLTGLPLAAPMSTLGAVLAEEEWRNPLDVTSDFLYGRRQGQPWNLVQGVADWMEGSPRGP